MVRPKRASLSSIGEVLSTAEVAKLLLVSEATIKRWADDGVLTCYRTAGGHRKFGRTDVEALVRSRGFPVPAPGLSVDWEQALRLALDADPAALEQLVWSALDGGMPLEVLFDTVLGRALVEIGDRWAAGTATIAEEHLVSTGIIDLLAILRHRLEQQHPASGRTALVACAAGERHEIGARMLSLCLRANGFSTLDMGADNSYDEVARMALTRPVELVVLSASSASDAGRRAVEGLGALSATLAAGAIRLFAGGTAFDPRRVPPEVRWAADCRSFVAALREGKSPSAVAAAH
jgi:excisionase family DNA binding protein